MKKRAMGDAGRKWTGKIRLMPQHKTERFLQKKGFLMKYEIVELKVRQVWNEVVSEPIENPGDVTAYLDRLDIKMADREMFVVIHLDVRNRVVAHEITSIGSQTASMVHPREVFKSAILKGACGIILAHNHPSGDPSPSKDDIDITNRLEEAGRLMGIEVLDHIIVAPPDRKVSMRGTGMAF